MARSVKALLEGQNQAIAAFELSGKSKEYLAGASNCSRPTLDKFFDGTRIDKQKFIGICEALEIKWTDIAELDTSDQVQIEDIAISELVAEIRVAIHASVEQECGTMRVLDMTRPIELNDIYTQVNILEKIIGRRGFNLDQLLQDCNLDLSLMLNLFVSIDIYNYCVFDQYRSLDLFRLRDLFGYLEPSLFSFDLSCYFDLSRSIEKLEDRSTKYALKKLQKLLPVKSYGYSDDKLRQWWRRKGKLWIDEFRDIIIKDRNIGHEWEFSKDQIDLLNQYLDANKLLVNCLNSESYISREVRQEIENTLLLPFEDLHY